MCRDVLASRELLGVARAHTIIVARPQHQNEKGQRQNQTVGTPTIPTNYTKWLLANNATRGSSRLAVLVIAFKSSIQSYIVKVSVRCEFGRL